MSTAMREFDASWFGYGDAPDPHAFVRWKGTSVRMDFYCKCGKCSHFDGDFAYAVRCTSCGTVYQMPYNLFPREIGPGNEFYERAKDLVQFSGEKRHT